MTHTPAPRRAVTPAGDYPLLLVAVCGGQRCRAVRALDDERSPDSPNSCSVIREAVRSTRNAVMLATGCLGPCAEGAVVAIGAAILTDRALAWVSPPTYWGSTQTAQRAAALSHCIKASAVRVAANYGCRTGKP